MRSLGAWQVAVVLLAFACSEKKSNDREIDPVRAMHESEEADKARRNAEQAANEAVGNHEEAKARFDAVRKELDALDRSVSDAVTAVAQAKGEQAVTDAKAHLAQ